MVVLKNINKTYKTKKTSPVDALKDINLTLPDQGLIFILGQSGSGKTTLMNIIGGLDTPTKGEMTFLDKEFTKNNQKELEDYRNKYIGFVFQDYNIIPELNVKENLMLGMTFQTTSKTNDKVEEVLEKVLLKDYEKRYPSELSGGQLQRIAIARSFMKDSKILLADEPTGNLDDETGDEIMKVLQEVATEKLVIVVTHNEELAKKYGKRIVRLKDGRIASDNGDSHKPLSTEKYDASDKKRLSNVVALKMGFNNLGLRKLRLFITVFLMSIAFAAIAMTLSAFSYHYADPHAELIKTRRYEYFELFSPSYYEWEEIKRDYPDIIGVAGQIIKTKSDLEKYGLELYPKSIEIDKNSYYISESLLHPLYDRDYPLIIDGKEVNLDYDKYPLETLIGAEIERIRKGMTIAGIFKSSFITDPQGINRGFDDYRYRLSAKVFFSEDSLAFWNGRIGSSNPKDITQVFVQQGGSQVNLQGVEVSVYDRGPVEPLVAKAGIIINTKLSGNEIYLSFDTYAKIFQDQNLASHYVIGTGDDTMIVNELTHVGKKIELQIRDIKNGLSKSFEFKIKGVYFGDRGYGDIFMNEETFLEPGKYRDTYSVIVKTSSIKNLTGFLRHCVNKYDIEIFTPISLNTFEELIHNIQFSMLLVTALLVVVVVLQIIALISQGITARRKEIGILKALGARSRDIRKIFIYENLILVIPITILAIVASIIFVNVINVNFVAYYSSDYTFLYYKPCVAFATLGATLVIGLLATLIPLYRINKMKPVDAIKN